MDIIALDGLKQLLFQSLNNQNFSPNSMEVWKEHTVWVSHMDSALLNIMGSNVFLSTVHWIALSLVKDYGNNMKGYEMVKSSKHCSKK